MVRAAGQPDASRPGANALQGKGKAPRRDAAGFRRSRDAGQTVEIDWSVSAAATTPTAASSAASTTVTADRVVLRSAVVGHASRGKQERERRSHGCGKRCRFHFRLLLSTCRRPDRIVRPTGRTGRPRDHVTFGAAGLFHVRARPALPCPGFRPAERVPADASHAQASGASPGSSWLNRASTCATTRSHCAPRKSNASRPAMSRSSVSDARSIRRAR